MKKKLSIILSIVIIINISFCGCISEEEVSELIFLIKFEPSNETHYYIIIPFPIYNNTPNEKILSKLEDSDVDFKIVTTIFGIGLNISSKSKIDISIKGKADNNMFNYELSMLNGTISLDEGEFMYFSTINGTIEYKFKVRDDSMEINYHVTSEINTGWQKIEMTRWKHDID